MDRDRWVYSGFCCVRHVGLSSCRFLPAWGRGMSSTAGLAADCLAARSTCGNLERASGARDWRCPLSFPDGREKTHLGVSKASLVDENISISVTYT